MVDRSWDKLGPLSAPGNEGSHVWRYAPAPNAPAKEIGAVCIGLTDFRAYVRRHDTKGTVRNICLCLRLGAFNPEGDSHQSASNWPVTGHIDLTHMVGQTCDYYPYYRQRKNTWGRLQGVKWAVVVPHVSRRTRIKHIIYSIGCKDEIRKK